MERIIAIALAELLVLGIEIEIVAPYIAGEQSGSYVNWDDEFPSEMNDADLVALLSKATDALIERVSK